MRVIDNGVEMVSLADDGFGRRIRKDAGGQAHRYLHSNYDVVEERLSTETIQHVHGTAIDQPLGIRNAAGVATFYSADHIGTIVRASDASGNPTLLRQYDAFGKQQEGSLSGGYAFNGREWDAETQLYYYRALYYEPTSGRFLSQDPVGLEGGINLYAYVNNAPVQWIDPDGLNACKKCGIKRAQEYNVQGSVRGGTAFHWSAKFLNDANHDPKCCEIRQHISWNRGGAPHRGFQPPRNQPGQWYEDRDQRNKRYGRRQGPYSDLQRGFDWYTSDGYSGTDTPSGFPPGTILRLRLMVVDVCDGENTIYTSKTLNVNF